MWKRTVVIMGILVTSLTFLAPRCFGQTQHQTTATAQNTLKTFLKEYLQEQGVENDNTTRYVSAFVDLNDDGTKEVIVHLTCQSLCGTGGCPTLVLAPTGSSYKLITRIPITHPPIRVLAKKSNGWHNIAVWVQGGGIQPGYEAELRFDGDTYPSNPTVPPARRLTKKVAGQVLVSSTAMGIPLN